jgi:hypothetical protein
MNAHNSRLVPHDAFQGVLSDLNPAIVNWIAGLALPLGVPPPNLLNAATGETLSAELRLLYDRFAKPGAVTNSGGYVAASKTTSQIQAHRAQEGMDGCGISLWLQSA